MFEHRHYKEIARIISQLDPDLREQVADHFAYALSGSNPRYARVRFHTAAMGSPSNGRDK